MPCAAQLTLSRELPYQLCLLMLRLIHSPIGAGTVSRVTSLNTTSAFPEIWLSSVYSECLSLVG